MPTNEPAHGTLAEAVAAPWERQNGETSRQFAAYQIYRDMHPTVRSLAKVGEQLGQSSTYIERLSAQWKWVDRTESWDEERDRQRRVRLLNQQEEMEKQHLEIASTALSKISRRLQDLEPADIGPQHLPKLWEMAARAQQMVFGESSEALPAEQPIRADELRSMLEEERMLDAEAESESAPDESEPARERTVEDWLDGRWPDP